MNRLALGLVPAVALAVAGCGAAGCSSAAADIANPGGSCTVASGSTVQVSVNVNCKCTDTSAACQAEWIGNRLEVAPTVQQCSDQAGCDTAGCDVSGKTATCVASNAAPTASGTYPIVDGSGSTIGNIVVGGGSSGCTL